MMAATALLYLGPLLAGMAGFGWVQVHVFAMMFLIWLVVVRPQDFPADPSAWRQPRTLIALLARVSVQLLLVAVCFGIGRAIGGMLGFLPAVPLALPFALSAAGVLLGRAVADPLAAMGVQTFAPEAVLHIAPPPAPVHPASAPSGGGLDWAMVLAPVLALPSDAPEARALEAIRLAGREVEVGPMLSALARALLEAPGRHQAVRFAFVRLVTEPELADLTFGRMLQAQAFYMAPDHPHLLAFFAQRAEELLRQRPDAWADMPTEASVRRAAAQAETATAEVLERVVAELERIAPAD